MRSHQDIESFIERAQLPHERVGKDGMWLLRDSGLGESIVVSMADTLLLFRVKVLELATVKDNSRLFEELLKLNASDLVHGAYGISDGAVVLTCALQLENLNFNEFQATIDDFSLALGNHYETLAAYRSARSTSWG